MALPISQDIIDRARAREKISTAERRQAVAFLMATNPMTNEEMAQLFSVSERTIRVDKKSFREEKAKLIRSEDVGLVIADILLDFDRQVQDLEKNKSKAKAGSRTYLDHCTAAMDMRLKTVKALQDLGYYPKNLGNMTVEKFEYKAIVTKDGSVETRRVDMFDEGSKVVDVKATPADAEKRKALSAEFGIDDEASPDNSIRERLENSVAGEASDQAGGAAPSADAPAAG